MANKIDDFLVEIFFKQKKKTKIRELISLCQLLLEKFDNKLFPFQFNEVEKQGVIAYSTDRENEASTMFIQRKRNGIINNCEICMTAQSLFSSHVFFQVAFVKSLMTIPYFPEVHRF